MTSQNRTATEALASFTVDLDPAAVPSEVRERAGLAVADALTIGIAGRAVEETRLIEDGLGELGMSAGTDTSVTVTDGTRRPVFAAAAVNGTAAFALNLGDTSLRTICHCGPVVVPAALASAEARGATVEELLVAVVAGYEVMERVARALGEDGAGLFLRGFHPTGTAGVYGAAACAGKLAGLDADRLAVGFGICGSLMIGSRQAAHTDGATSSLWLHAGLAAGLGTFAATLAAAGLDAPRDILEGAEGVLRAYGGTDAGAEIATSGLGNEWLLLEMATKLHCCSQTLAPVVDAALAIRARVGERAERAREVVVALPALQLRVSEARGGRPVSFVDAQSSAAFIVAQALLHGRVSPTELAPAELVNERTGRLAERVRVETGEFPVPSWPARVELALADGERVSETVLHPHGSAELPATAEDIRDKLCELVPELGPEASSRLLSAVRDGGAPAASLWLPFASLW